MNIISLNPEEEFKATIFVYNILEFHSNPKVLILEHDRCIIMLLIFYIYTIVIKYGNL